MPFQFHIKPLGELEQGFELSCEGIFPSAVHHDRFIEAVIHAVQIGHHLPGEIKVFGCEGRVIETLPLRWDAPAFNHLSDRRAA
jgi:hypothetical protein